MKYLYIITCTILFSPSLTGQKHDYVWVMGKDDQADSLFAGIVIDFNTSPSDIYYEFRDMHFYETNTSMCDIAGNLLFYTNGIYIANALGDTIENGGGLNPGQMAIDYQDDGYVLNQGVLSIPVPNNDSLFYLLHMDYNYPIAGGEPFSEKLYYSLINMEDNNGLGDVIIKNELIIEDRLEPGKITAVKHANGMDWWMIIRKESTNKYYTILITDNGIIVDNLQTVGDNIPSPGLGQAVFSPDGTKFASLELVNGVGNDNYINVYDFDRCLGELSNHISIAYLDSAWSGGVAISPNSRFLYVSSYNYVYQYDFWADDLEASKDTVAIYDGFSVLNFFRTRFSLMQLGPNGKIYITSSHSVPYLHVINNPNLLGDSCDVCQHCVQLPSFNPFSMPNFPNYRLGASETPCEPDAIDEPEEPDIEVSVYPNPTSGVVWVEMEKDWQGSIFVLYDALGRTVQRKPLLSAETAVSLGGVGEGLYFYEVKKDGGVLDSGKIVVLE